MDVTVMSWHDGSGGNYWLVVSRAGRLMCGWLRKIKDGKKK